MNRFRRKIVESIVTEEESNACNNYIKEDYDNYFLEDEDSLISEKRQAVLKLKDNIESGLLQGLDGYEIIQDLIGIKLWFEKILDRLEEISETKSKAIEFSFNKAIDCFYKALQTTDKRIFNSLRDRIFHLLSDIEKILF